MAGWGDIAAGLGALVLAALSIESASGRSLWKAWNVFGLADIVLVVVSAQRTIVFDKDLTSLAGLLEFPGPVLPLFVVPIVIATHLLLFSRLSNPARGSLASGQ